ncbi:ubiquitin-conjugating enzyme E2 I [Nematocida major]|uniref:ubiquitin-conjugating enzyme E2 I n=1 Tax=Nematocida major TaxID=1912982 RepID=UPI0020083310|nr:ubiquitin-conjugating enzyme E2 I [Nematocida major]KAH9385944.1 ubiquitin-conjugating enzyme E2 I [Nematocida major]
MNAEQRIMQERENWRKDRPLGFVAKPLTNADKTLDLFRWHCSMPGPESSPFAGHTLSLLVEFFATYPASAPQVKFITKVFHPNVYADGFVCLDILASEWSPSLNIKTILLAVHALLEEPNIDSPANEEAASLYVERPEKYIRLAIKALAQKKPKPRA